MTAIVERGDRAVMCRWCSRSLIPDGHDNWVHQDTLAWLCRPVLLDLFCKAGGMTKGYQRAGFHVIGVDIDPQPNYCGDSFIQADVTEFRGGFIGVDAIHASPPCQRYSDLAHRNGNADEWPDLIEPVRKMLQASGVPYVIGNVEGAPLIDPVMLCGTMFPGLRVLRHRLFETNFPVDVPPHGKHPLVFTHDKRKGHYGKLDQDTSFVQVTGGGNCSVANAADAMGIDWMTKAELNEAIPPAYAEHIGRQLIEHLHARGASAVTFDNGRAIAPEFALQNGSTGDPR